jgi:hypothetical protein
MKYLEVLAIMIQMAVAISIVYFCLSFLIR